MNCSNGETELVHDRISTCPPKGQLWWLRVRQRRGPRVRAVGPAAAPARLARHRKWGSDSCAELCAAIEAMRPGGIRPTAPRPQRALRSGQRTLAGNPGALEFGMASDFWCCRVIPGV